VAVVNIPGGWTPSTEGLSSLIFCGQTVGSVLEQLTTAHPDLHKRIFHGERIASWVNVYVADQDVRWTGGLATEVGPDSTMTILPALAGG